MIIQVEDQKSENIYDCEGRPNIPRKTEETDSNVRCKGFLSLRDEFISGPGQKSINTKVHKASCE